MPLYDFKCDSCDIKKLNHFTHDWKEKPLCPTCKKPMRKLISLFVPKVFPPDGITLEHVAANPVTFHSEKEMRDYAKKNDLELGALL